jgi:hypothetical protein
LQLNIHKFKVVARFGLMHLIATNVCVWMRTIVREGLMDFTRFYVKEFQGPSEDHLILCEHATRRLKFHQTFLR